MESDLPVPLACSVFLRSVLLLRPPTGSCNMQVLTQGAQGGPQILHLSQAPRSGWCCCSVGHTWGRKVSAHRPVRVTLEPARGLSMFSPGCTLTYSCLHFSVEGHISNCSLGFNDCKLEQSACWQKAGAPHRNSHCRCNDSVEAVRWLFYTRYIPGGDSFQLYGLCPTVRTNPSGGASQVSAGEMPQVPCRERTPRAVVSVSPAGLLTD